MSKTALITGSSRGLGRALSVEFSKKGYNIILHGRDIAALEKTKHEVEKSNIKSFIVQGDLTSRITLDKLVEKAKEKDISVLINNAAITCPGINFKEYSSKQIKDMVYVNLIFPILLSKEIYKILRENKGTIININSIAGIEPKTPRTLYCASKWGLRGFSESLRMESEKEGIRVMDIYLSKMRGVEDKYGMNLKRVAQKIYKSFENNVERLIIDGRPSGRITEWPNAIVVDGRAFEIRLKDLK